LGFVWNLVLGAWNFTDSATRLLEDEKGLGGLLFSLVAEDL